MSGIVAYVGCGLTHRAVDTVREISSRLDHRGPDDHGILVWSPPGEASFIEDSRGHRSSLPAQRPDSIPWTAVLAARHLSISDLSEAGHQPMLDAKQSCAVVLDGAIYNRSELRSELTAQGHRFRSRSDTEVLLEAYLEWGADCVSRLVGMFAFVVLDMPRRRVLIARDRFGLKPLFETTLTTVGSSPAKWVPFSRAPGSAAARIPRRSSITWPQASQAIHPTRCSPQYANSRRRASWSGLR